MYLRHIWKVSAQHCTRHIFVYSTILLQLQWA